MENFIPFIHQIEEKKEELLPLYIELPSPIIKKQEIPQKDEPYIIIIEL